MIEIGKFLAKKRMEKGWTQDFLAEKTQLPQSTIKDIEIGKSKDPGVLKVAKIAAALGIHPIELFDFLQGKEPADLSSPSEQQAANEYVVETLQELLDKLKRNQ